MDDIAISGATTPDVDAAGHGQGGGACPGRQLARAGR